MYQVGDRVRKRLFVGDIIDGYKPEGFVIDLNGRWITVKHDALESYHSPLHGEAPRHDYLADELEHINPLLRLVSEL